ncbi:hypothetical protein RJ55_03937 [Drechmeria coniospora]|nr:hypothetical protein RJ55_03937 [Drechmeria coniospora]
MNPEASNFTPSESPALEGLQLARTDLESARGDKHVVRYPSLYHFASQITAAAPKDAESLPDTNYHHSIPQLTSNWPCRDAGLGYGEDAVSWRHSLAFTSYYTPHPPATDVNESLSMPLMCARVPQAGLISPSQPDFELLQPRSGSNHHALPRSHITETGSPASKFSVVNLSAQQDHKSATEDEPQSAQAPSQTALRQRLASLGVPQAQLSLRSERKVSIGAEWPPLPPAPRQEAQNLFASLADFSAKGPATRARRRRGGQSHRGPRLREVKKKAIRQALGPAPPDEHTSKGVFEERNTNRTPSRMVNPYGASEYHALLHQLQGDVMTAFPSSTQPSVGPRGASPPLHLSYATVALSQEDIDFAHQAQTMISLPVVAEVAPTPTHPIPSKLHPGPPERESTSIWRHYHTDQTMTGEEAKDIITTGDSPSVVVTGFEANVSGNASQQNASAEHGHRATPCRAQSKLSHVAGISMQPMTNAHELSRVPFIPRCPLKPSGGDGSNNKLVDRSALSLSSSRDQLLRESGSWSHSKRWVSEGTRERAAFARTMSNMHHIGADKSPFIPHSLSELAALKIQIADANRHELAQNVGRKLEELERRRILAEQGEKHVDIKVEKLFWGRLLDSKLSPVFASDNCFNACEPGAHHRVNWPSLAELKDEGERRGVRFRRYLPLPRLNLVDPRILATEQEVFNPDGTLRWQVKTQKPVWPYLVPVSPPEDETLAFAFGPSSEPQLHELPARLQDVIRQCLD